MAILAGDSSYLMLPVCFLHNWVLLINWWKQSWEISLGFDHRKFKFKKVSTTKGLAIPCPTQNSIVKHSIKPQCWVEVIWSWTKQRQWNPAWIFAESQGAYKSFPDSFIFFHWNPDSKAFIINKTAIERVIYAKHWTGYLGIKDEWDLSHFYEFTGEPKFILSQPSPSKVS